MIEIIKYGCKYTLDNKSVASIQAAYDGLQVVLNDQTEIRFAFQVSPQIRAIIPIIKSCTNTSSMVIDLDSAINGHYDKVLVLRGDNKGPQPISNVAGPSVMPDKGTTKEKTDKKTTTTNKGARKPGRPKKSTTK